MEPSRPTCCDALLPLTFALVIRTAARIAALTAALASTLAAALASALAAALLGVLAHTAALLGALTLRYFPSLRRSRMVQKRRVVSL
jgi:urea transporter